MVNTGGTRTCVHLHVSYPLYHCATVCVALWHLVSVRTFGVMYDHTFYKQVQISRSDIRPHIKWAVSLVILHMVTSISLQGLCGYIWVNILTLSPQRGHRTTDADDLADDLNYVHEDKHRTIKVCQHASILSHQSFATLWVDHDKDVVTRFTTCVHQHTWNISQNTDATLPM